MQEQASIYGPRASGATRVGLTKQAKTSWAMLLLLSFPRLATRLKRCNPH